VPIRSIYRSRLTSHERGESGRSWTESARTRIESGASARQRACGLVSRRQCPAVAGRASFSQTQLYIAGVRGDRTRLVRIVFVNAVAEGVP
jgi:hypothetical protein